MQEWSNVEVNVGGDETGNFGPRVESGSALYQVETHATISTNDMRPYAVPRLGAYADEDSVCILTDEHLSLFTGSCSTIHATMVCESVVDCVTSSETGAFIALAERSGSLRLLDAHTQTSLFSKKLVEPSASEKEPTFTNLWFTSLSTEGVCELCVVSRDRLFWFSNLQLDLLQTALQTRDVASARTLQQDICTELLDTNDIHTERCSHTSLTPSGGILTCGAGENVLCVWERDWLDGNFEACATAPESLTDDAGITKCFVLPCGRLLLALDEKGHLSLWDTEALLCVRFWTDRHVKDFLGLCAGEKHSEEVSVVLVSQQNPTAPSSVQVCHLPSLQVVYTLQLSPVLFLASSPSNQEAIMLIEGVNEEDSDSAPDRISTLRVRSLTEAQPDTRFMRMLQKKQFQQAEEFAKLYNLDTESIYKVKAIHLLGELSPWNSANLSEEQKHESLMELRTCLEKVGDSAWIAQSCVSACLPNFQAQLKLLQLAKSRLSEKQKSNTQINGHSNGHINGDMNGHVNGHVVNGEEDTELNEARRESLLTDIFSTLHRLGTFQVVFGIHAFSGARWEDFLRASMWSEFLKWLSQGEISRAISLWRRHQSDFEESFGEAHLEDTLCSIPEWIRARDLHDWLANDVIPFVIRVHPDGLKAVASWLEQRARNMEITEKEGWPENSLALCELLRNTCVSASQAASERGNYTPHHFATQICNLSVAHSQVIHKKKGASNKANTTQMTESQDENNVNTEPEIKVGDTDPFVSLHTLVQHLTHLVSLHRKYHCYLSLDQYVQETVESLTYRLLDRVVALELIPEAIERVVRPYMKEHHLVPEKMLYQYIGDLVEQAGHVMSVTGGAPWEAKAIAVIQCIENPQYKIGGILDAMKHAYVPWSADMEALIQEGLKLKHPRVTELEKQCQVAALRRMLAAYELRHLNLTDKSCAETLLYYIMKQDRATALEDAELVVQAFSNLSMRLAWVYRLRFLLERDRVTDALGFIQGLDATDAIYCCQRFVQLTIVMLDRSIVYQQNQLERKQVYTNATITILTFLIKHTIDVFDKEEWIVLQRDLTALHSLQVEFGEYMSVRDYRDESCRSRLLRQYLKSFYTQQDKLDASLPAQTFDTDRKPPRKQGWSLVKLYRLAALLQWSSNKFKGYLAICAAEMGKFNEAISLANEVWANSQDSDSAEVLYRVACSLTGHVEALSHDQAMRYLPGVISDMASRAITACKPALLVGCLELARCSNMAHSVARQCESGDYDITLKRTVGAQKQDVYKEWCFEPLYREDGLVMEAEQTLPLVYQYSEATLKDQKEGAKSKSGEEDEESFALADLCKKTSQVVAHLRENSQSELALKYAARSLAVCLQRQAALNTGVLPIPGEALQQQEQLKPLLAINMKTATELVTHLTQKVFTSSPVDKTLALGYVCAVGSVSRQTAFDQLHRIEKGMGHNYKRLLALGEVGEQYADLLSDIKLKVMFEELCKDATWGAKLAKLKVSFAGAFRQPMSNKNRKEELIQTMVKCPDISVLTIKQYCRAFELFEDQALISFLCHLLLSGGHNTDDDVISKASQVFATMTRDIDLVDKLQKLLSKIDSYDYARLGFVLRALVSLDAGAVAERGLQVLKCIESYTRTQPPNQYEINYRARSEEEEMISLGKLSPLSKSRLPFHPLVEGDAFKIITPELNAQTLNLWTPVASVLKISRDMLYLTTIQNIVKSHKAQSAAMKTNSANNGAPVDKSKCNWDSGEGVNQALFDTMMNILLRVSNCEHAVMCAAGVVKELPMGAEKVFALRNSVKLAKQWLQIAADEAEAQKAQEATRKFTAMCRCLSTEQILYQHGLGEPELVELAPRAAVLIMKLYEHDSIQARVTGAKAAAALPDIHFVANEIAAICGLSAQKIRQTLLQKWLPPTQRKPESELDQTMNATLNAGNLEMTLRSEEERNEDEVNLKRAIYLLQHDDLYSNAKLLIASIKQSGSQMNPQTRVRTMRCLFSLVDSHTISQLSAMPASTIKEQMETLLYLVELQRLSLPHSASSFLKCNKTGLVKGIWRNHSHDYRAVRLVCDLCLDYGICDVQLWDSLLQQLLAFRMLDYLRHVLVCLSGVPELWHVASVQSTWRSVLMTPLTSAVAPLINEQIQECYATLTLIHRCPVLLDLDLSQITHQLCQLEVPELALSCALLITSDKVRVSIVTQLLEQLDQVKILDKLDRWKEEGHALPLHEQMRQAVFEYVDDHALYENLAHTTNMRACVTHLIQERSLKQLLLHTVKLKQLLTAESWVELEMQLHPDTQRSRDIKAQAIHPLDKLKLYLQMHNAYEEVEHYFPAVKNEETDNSTLETED